jgi:hypothetical protein
MKLMDSMLKDINKDMKLTLYNCLAYSNDDGIMECVENVKDLQNVLEEGIIEYINTLVCNKLKIED